MISSPDFYYNQMQAILPCLKGRTIAIWGTTERGRLVKETLEFCGFSCGFFVSSRAKKKSYLGLPIYTPDVLEADKHYVINVAITSRSEIDRLLLEKGFVQEGWRDCFTSTDWHDDLIYKGIPIGRGTYGYDTFLQDRLLVKRIGRYCSIAGSAACVGNHPTQLVTTGTFESANRIFAKKVPHCPPPPNNGHVFSVNCFEKAVDEERRKQYQTIEIGNDVWIGSNATVLPHVKIGDGAVIGAGAVVTHDVPPYAIVAGVPARIIRYRFPQQIIDAMLKIQWWNWPVEKINENLEFFTQPELFCEIFGMENDRE